MIKTTPEHIKLMEDIHLDVCNEYGYKPVPISLNERLTAKLGHCVKYGSYYNENYIELSTKCMEANDWNIEILTALIKHETAHLKYNGHGYNFTKECHRMGLKSNHTYNDFDIKEPQCKYTAVCPSCGHTHQQSRKSKNMNKTSCGHCSNVYDKTKKLTYVQKW